MKIYSSTLNYYMACPGYLSGEFQDDSPWAIEGTLLHEVLETGDRSKLDPENTEHPGLLDSCEEVFQALFPTYIEREEEKVLKPVLKNTRKAKVDRYVLVSKSHAGVIDWKFGRNAVPDAELNWQGKDYAMRVMLSEPGIKQVTVAFVLPRRNEVSVHTFSAEDAVEIKGEIAACVNRVASYQATKDISLLKPGVLVGSSSVCTYCDRKAECPALSQRAVALAEGRAEVKNPTPIDWAHPSTIDDPAVIARMKDAAKVLESWCESVHFRANQLFFVEGKDIPGYTTGVRSGRRSLGAPEDVYAAISEEFEISELDFIRACDKVSITRLEQVVSENAKRGEKKEKKEAVCRLLIEEGLLSSGEEKEILVKEK